MRIVTIPVGSKCIDTNTKLTTVVCKDLKNEGIVAVGRYTFYGKPQPGDLDAKETDIILSNDLGLFIIQHVRRPTWQPSAELGGEDAVNAIDNIKACGITVPSAPVWCDLEGNMQNGTMEYENAWTAKMLEAENDPGDYIGAGMEVFSPGQLFHDLHTKRYWRSQSEVPNVWSRGYQLIQLFPSFIFCGIDVDITVSQKDYHGDLPTMIVKD